MSLECMENLATTVDGDGWGSSISVLATEHLNKLYRHIKLLLHTCDQVPIVTLTSRRVDCIFSAPAFINLRVSLGTLATLRLEIDVRTLRLLSIMDGRWVVFDVLLNCLVRARLVWFWVWVKPLADSSACLVFQIWDKLFKGALAIIKIKLKKKLGFVMSAHEGVTKVGYVGRLEIRKCSLVLYLNDMQRCRIHKNIDAKCV